MRYARGRGQEVPGTHGARPRGSLGGCDVVTGRNIVKCGFDVHRRVLINELLLKKIFPRLRGPSKGPQIVDFFYFFWA